jgi:hypothetical protein
MDRELREAQRRYSADPSGESRAKYRRVASRFGKVPCDFCPTLEDPSNAHTCNYVDDQEVLVCGLTSCEKCSSNVVCADADCDARECPACADPCPKCGRNICPGGHNTTCDDCGLVTCLECNKYCEGCGETSCNLSDDGLCGVCYEQNNEDPQEFPDADYCESCGADNPEECNCDHYDDPFGVLRRNPDLETNYWTEESLPFSSTKPRQRAQGYILYEGPSLYDRQPIVAIATGFINPSVNPKTGPMIQIVIIRSDVHPQEAMWSGEDKSICGRCIHRGDVERAQERDLPEHRTAETALSHHRSCYVRSHPIISMYNAYKRGGYPHLPLNKIAEVFRKSPHPPRFGAYGDPAMVPVSVWAEVVKYSKKWTGYTSQWRLKRVQAYKPYLNASVNTYDDYWDAKNLGWRTYRVGRKDEPLLESEIYCPESPEGGKINSCGTCTLCMGTSRKAPDILTRPTGKGAGFHDQHTSRRAPRRLPVKRRRHNPRRNYYHNPTNAQDLRTVNKMLKDLKKASPCEKKAWGLRRRYFRNPYSDYF